MGTYWMTMSGPYRLLVTGLLATERTARLRSAAAGLALLTSTAATLVSGPPAVAATGVPIEWERLRPLDHDPALDSGEPLDRPCVPGETVVLRRAQGVDSAARLGLGEGQFVVCIGNTGTGGLELVDGPGNTWTVSQDEVNATAGFPANWAAHDRDYLVWAYDRDTIVFRESLRNSFEGNFLYLLLDRAADGSIDRAMLIDSGTGYIDLAPYVMSVVQDRPLIVLSTHSHWDHFGGHRHFIGMDNVELLGYRPGREYNPYPKPPEYDIEGLKRYFGLADWPAGSADYKLGSRDIVVLPMPGHTADSIALYDHREQLLFTGDTLYPGLLFIESWQDFSASLARLEAFVRRHPVKWMLGGHLEMSRKRAFNDRHEYFFFGTNTHWQSLPPNMPLSYLALARSIIDDRLANAEQGVPRYDAQLIDRDFHSVPLVPVPFPGIPSYYRSNAQRLVDQLVERHRLHDRDRRHRAGNGELEHGDSVEEHSQP